ncbi:MmgE/PrpD family protein [Microterricola pindariensis]|uniref:2-methylcitrate dehydratase n=1 Tax=Microterricola pindariensis TaxID=478010 RepID=A0ABX5AVK5_9MICO|nr:MmgE/PrpD family protein [Microterricola pindariensis]PPL17196.1 hypothetical protein GY24_11730 [Microterricola pindariensis]
MTELPSITQPLADWCGTLTLDDFTPQAQARALDSVVDTVGVAIAASGEPDYQAAEEFAVASHGAPGDAQVWGRGRGANASEASLLNGTAGHLMDFDDVHYLIHGHASTVLLPALFAAGQAAQVQPRRVMLGYMAGLGVMSAVARAYGPRHYSRGWHSTSTCGAVGAAAGVATMLGLSVSEIAHSMSAGVSMSFGVRANFGTILKPLHAGLAARAGVEAVLLTRAGGLAAPNALERDLGGVRVFGDGSWPGEYADPVATILETAAAGTDELGVKLYPCCRGGHYAIDATLDVREVLPSGVDVDSVTVRVPLGARTALIHDDPETGLQAKFSLPYAVATSLVRGIPSPDHFSDEAIHDDKVQRVMRAITVIEDESSGDLSAGMEGRYAEIEVVCAGRRYSARCDDARGSWSRPLTQAEVDGKFLRMASRSHGVDGPALLRRLRALQDAESLVGLFG